MTIADRLAVFLEGRIVQVGTPDQVFDHPASVEVAGFIGSPPMNLMPAQIDRGVLSVDRTRVALNRDPGPDGNVVLGVRPGAVRLADHGLAGRVELVENLGDTTIVDVESGGRLIKLRSDGRPRISEGENVYLAFAAGAIHLFDASSGQRR